MKNYGLQNEIDFKNAINGKRYDELTPFLKTIFTRTVKNIEEDTVFQCDLSNRYFDTDIKV